MCKRNKIIKSVNMLINSRITYYITTLIVTLIVILLLLIVISNNIYCNDNIELYPVTPFKSSDATVIELQKQFESKLRSFSIESDYNIYASIIKRIIKQTSLCKDYQNLPPDKLFQNCFNNQPDQAASLINLLSLYVKLKSDDLFAILNIYSNKFKSSKFTDRIEAKLFFYCLQDQYSKDNDKSNIIDIIDYCKDYNNFSVSNLLSELSNCYPVNDHFDFREFTKSCIISNYAVSTEATNIISDLLLDFRFSINSNRITLSFEPFQLNSKDLFSILYLRNMNILHSDYFKSLKTNACIPSIFATSIQDNTSYSMCLPKNLVKELYSLNPDDQEFYIEKLSNKLTTISLLQLLESAELISQESYRVLRFIDSDLSDIALINYRFFSTLVNNYKSNIDLTDITTVSDILNSIHQLYNAYQQEKANIQDSVNYLTQEIQKRKIDREFGPKN